MSFPLLSFLTTVADTHCGRLWASIRIRLGLAARKGASSFDLQQKYKMDYCKAIFE
jgi:hypothetical protein